MKTHKLKFLLPILLITLYFFVNLLFLETYPFVHSDEAWLSGLSRTVIDKGSFNTTESFFDLYPRTIHGLRFVFVSLQIVFIKVLGYSVFSIRLMALLAGSLVLGLVYRILGQAKKGDKDLGSNRSYVSCLLPTLGVIALASNNQFIMSAHTGRQDILILLVLVYTYHIIENMSLKHEPIITACIIGMAISIHPNSFIVGLSVGLVYLYQVLVKEKSIVDLLEYILVLAGFALFFVLISIKMNPNFIHEYMAFGKQVGINTVETGRLKGYYYFFYKLYNQIGGTYKLVDIRYELLLMFVMALVLVKQVMLKFRDKTRSIDLGLIMLFGINLGILVIGRFNQTSVIFPITFVYIILYRFVCLHFEKWLKMSGQKWFQIILYGLVILGSIYPMANSYNDISKSHYTDYESYGKRVLKNIPDDSIILGNLNLDYHLKIGQLYDVRNLMHLQDSQLSFENYIQKNNISHIILYEEMSYIHDAQGKWDMLYGDLSYYDDMISFLDKHTSLIDEFSDTTYPIRIAKYIDSDYLWTVKIYLVD